MQSARTVPFDVSGLSEGTHNRVLSLDLPPDGVIYDTEEVTAAVEVAREERTVTFAGLGVEIVGLPKGKALPASVTVKVKGPIEMIRSLEKENVVPRVEIPEADRAKPGSLLATVVVDVPGAEVEVVPEKVLVKW
jgi:hypothetical protein